jgi:hypothetical protein
MIHLANTRPRAKTIYFKFIIERRSEKHDVPPLVSSRRSRAVSSSTHQARPASCACPSNPCDGCTDSPLKEASPSADRRERSCNHMIQCQATIIISGCTKLTGGRQNISTEVPHHWYGCPHQRHPSQTYRRALAVTPLSDTRIIRCYISS